MSATPNSHSRPRRFTARRLALLTGTIAGLSAAALFVAPHASYGPPAALAQNLSHEAQQLARPTGFADIVEKVKPAVISVRVKSEVENTLSDDDFPFPKGSPMERFFRQFGLPDQIPGVPRGRRYTASQGSGFFISSDGYAVTNNHVVENATSLEVTTDDGKTHRAKVIGTDPRTDLALIKVEGGNFPYVNFADKPPRIGDWVLAVGNPFGLGGTVTAGIVSARGRDIGAGPYDDFLQIDAPVNKGNSGGPTFNTDGSVIGVNTAIFSPSGGSIGIAFAIPAETVKTVVAQLKEKGTVVRGWIGVHIQPVTPPIAESLGLKEAKGALVAEPQRNSPADKAGIKAGDVIVSVDGEPVKDARGLARKIAAIAPGTTVKLGLIRKGEEQTVSLTLGELPSKREARAERRDRPSPRNRDRNLQRSPGSQGGGSMSEQRYERSDRDEGPRLGLSLAPAGDEPGVVVAEIDPVSPAADYGVRVGDVILEVAGEEVKTPSDVRRALNKARHEGKRSVLMRVKTQQGTRFVAIPIDRA